MQQFASAVVSARYVLIKPFSVEPR